jgi:DnaK suppressor protein
MQRLLQRLEARERELRASIADERCRVETEELPQLREIPGDEVDRAFIVSQVGIDRSRVDRFAREIEAIVAMRERIGRGAGGICVGCGEAIGAARLLANPVADRCTDCQAAIEWAARSRAR